MRIAEARYVSRHQECFRKNNGAIFLPRVVDGDEKFGKAKAKHKERSILLTHAGVKAVETFFEQKVSFPSYQAMEKAIKLAAKNADIDTRYITTKMFRKTYITWLLNTYPEKVMIIGMSAGHSLNTMADHYVTAGFRKEDRADMKAEVSGWGDI